MISVALVIMVVFVFLRNVRATLIPSVAVPVSLVGTFAMMWAFGFSLDTLSLMALIVSIGFLVDDAIVVVENIARHIEQGVKPFQAALLGAREVGFTVTAMSVSLVAVFIPLLLLGGPRRRRPDQHHGRACYRRRQHGALLRDLFRLPVLWLLGA